MRSEVTVSRSRGHGLLGNGTGTAAVGHLGAASLRTFLPCHFLSITIDELRETRRKRSPFERRETSLEEMKGWSAEERGGHTFISLSLHKGSPLSVFSSSPLSSHVPVVAASAPFLLLCSLCPRCSEASPEMKAAGDKGRQASLSCPRSVWFSNQPRSPKHPPATRLQVGYILCETFLRIWRQRSLGGKADSGR
ncbi:unnamed protein product [Pleuronectes platessa]|uniref:Uncharacterized protein n=1 Tax=Pleuronectes platessa TaxID=8262 RepID=A0A9N7U8N5_PLEPL|nr:unnamed protein product [Pleuronectes platessa]